MTEARYTLTIPALTHDGANDLASALEENVRIDPMAVTINETDEAKGLWELVLYFESEQDAQDARSLDELRGGLIAPMPQQDWVRQSLEGASSCTVRMTGNGGGRAAFRWRSMRAPLSVPATTAPPKAASSHWIAC